MGYSNVGTPSFFIDNYFYRKTIGGMDNARSNLQGDINILDDDLFTLRPSSYKTLQNQNGTGSFDIYIPNTGNYTYSGNMSCYVAILNHAFTQGDNYITNISYHDVDFSNLNTASFSPIVNDIGEGAKNGSTILETTSEEENAYIGINFSSANSLNLGAISTGIKYKMTQTPELDVSMEIEHDGYKSITSSSGADITSVAYTGAPLWNNGVNFTNPFEIYSGALDVRNTGGVSNGRKSWDMKFKHLADEDMFSSNTKTSSHTENSSTYNSSDVNTDTANDYLLYNMNEDDSFIAQVWNKTLGGALPFIFQPDSDNYDDFYICKFDKDKLKVNQSAYKVYDISLKIVQVW